MTYWGYHFIGNFGKCNPRLIRCRDNITSFSRTLVKKIDMVPFGEPQLQHFGHGNKAGFTLVQLIETSNITAHFVEETNDVYLDVFSCKDFDTIEVQHMVHSFFEPSSSKLMLVKRQAPLKNEITSFVTYELK